MRLVLLLLIAATALNSMGASAAPVGQPQAPNGYGELVRAGQALKESRLFLQAQEPEATLNLKRAMLLDRPVIRAQALLKQGLGREIVAAPPAELEQRSAELGAFRNLGRLLQIQQYVYLADGRDMEALQAARTALRLGRVVRTDSLLTGLAGTAISTACLKSLGRYLDRFSAPDCETLFMICREWLAQGDPLPSILEAERKVGLDSVAKMRGQAAAEPGANPEAVNALFAGMEKSLGEFYDQLAVEIRKPSWKRGPLPVPKPAEDDPGAAVVAVLVPALQQALDKHTQEVAMVQLLACHAAVRRYRWEHDKLPPSLTELQLGELILDPFTGMPFKYEPQGIRYRLTSAGPRARAGDPDAVDGRNPVAVD